MCRHISDDLIAQVVSLKTDFTPIALGDTFAVGLAVIREATLVTTDRGELQKIATAGACNIEFLR